MMPYCSCFVVPGHGDLDIYCWCSKEEGKGTLGEVDPILYPLMSLGSWDLPNMGDSIENLIVTAYITNLLGKDPNRCQMTRTFCWPSTCVVSFYLFVDKASERKVSTFLIIFRKRFPTLVC